MSKNEVHINKDSDQKASDFLLNLSEKLEEENILSPIKTTDLTTNQVDSWELSKNPYKILKNISKRQSKVCNEEVSSDPVKRRSKKYQEKIDLAVDATACVKLGSCDFCSETGFYMKYKSLVRSLASQKWRAWTAGVSQITREQLRARMSGSAKAGSLNEGLQKLEESKGSGEKKQANFNQLPVNNETPLHKYQPLRKRFIPAQTTLKERKIISNQIFPNNHIKKCVQMCSYKKGRGQEQATRKASGVKKDLPNPPRTLTKPHSFHCSGQSFPLTTILPPISVQKVKVKNNKKI